MIAVDPPGCPATMPWPARATMTNAKCLKGMGFLPAEPAILSAAGARSAHKLTIRLKNARNFTRGRYSWTVPPQITGDLFCRGETTHARAYEVRGEGTVDCRRRRLAG